MNRLKSAGKQLLASFKTRAFRAGGYSVAATVIVVAIAVAVNMLVGALPASLIRHDTSANKLYTISDQTKALVGNLEREITVYWVVQAGQEDATIEALLDNYAALNDKVTVVKKDPDVYPTFAQQYTSDSVYNNSLVVECGSRYRYVSYDEIYVYDYTNYYYTGTYEVSFDGESALTSAIDYCLVEDLPKVYRLTGHGEAELSSAFQSAVEKQNVSVAQLSLLTAEEVPDDADCLFIYAPQSDLAQEEIEILQTYLSGGGKLMLVTNPLQDSSLPKLEQLMAQYGVTLAQGVVIEGNQSYYAFGAPYNLLPDYGSHDITASLVESGYYVLMSVAQGLQVDQVLSEGVAVTELLTTSSSAYSKAAGLDLTTYDKEEGDVAGPFSLGVAIEDSSSGAQLVWFSSAGLLDDTANAQVSGGNQELFLNALSWMCEPEESNLSIRAKRFSTEYLTIDSGSASVLTALVVGVIPLGYLAVGLCIYIRRKRR